MSIPDLINGAFELTGGVVCWLNVRRLLRDRRVKGVDWRVNAFFSSWGFWNLFYYPSLHQWASLAGGVALVIANTTWVVLALQVLRWQWHMTHISYQEDCSLCRKAMLGPVCAEVPSAKAIHEFTQKLKDLPVIAHTYKCECDLCNDVNNPRRKT